MLGEVINMPNSTQPFICRARTQSRVDSPPISHITHIPFIINNPHLKKRIHIIYYNIGYLYLFLMRKEKERILTEATLKSTYIIAYTI